MGKIVLLYNMLFYHIHPNSSETHFPFLTTQLCVLYFSPTNQVQFVLFLYSWMYGFPWSVMDLPGAMLLKRIDSPSFRSYSK